jgi:ribonuclease Y
MDSALLAIAGVLLVVTTITTTISIFTYNQLKKTKLDANRLVNEALEKSKKVSAMSEQEAVEKASIIAKNKILEAEKRASDIEARGIEDIRKIREQIKEQEKVLDEREKKLIERANVLDQRFDATEKKERALEQAKKDVATMRQDLKTQLEKIAQMTKQEAEAVLKKEVEKDLQDWTAKKIKEGEQQIEQRSDEFAQKIIVDTMQNSFTDYIVETTTTTFTIEDETEKGKVIGKEGRNIRTFEKVTGVDVIIDEAPNQVTLSCFDPIRREVAAISLQRLLKEGKVHPSSIEDMVEKVKKELLKEIRKTGEDFAYEVGFNNLPKEIILLLGRFKYRFGYGQNLLKHTLEVVKAGEYLATEIGADVRITKLACLLHDIGKVIPEEGKQHHHISAEIAKKYFNDPKLINAIEAHHFDSDAKSVEAEIVRIADALSASRPGARRNSYEDYVKRVRALEDIATKHNGVAEAYAVHAGREVRVIVKPKEVTDEDADVMAHKIAKEIEETQTYPGIIKVSVIREYRVIEEAK